MNIIVQPYGKTLGYCRPDTTWERENKDFYVPESVDTLLWTPVLFARISKAGKCIGEKFVSVSEKSARRNQKLYLHAVSDGRHLKKFALSRTHLLDNGAYTLLRNVDYNALYRLAEHAVYLLREHTRRRHLELIILAA